MTFLKLYFTHYNILFLSLQIAPGDLCLSCRAFTYSDQNHIANQRLIFDDKLKTYGKVKFFISCISGTSTNSGSNESRPCIAYFFVYDCKLTTEDDLFAIFHDNNLDPDLKKLNGDNNGRHEVITELKKVLKVSI